MEGTEAADAWGTVEGPRGARVRGHLDPPGSQRRALHEHAQAIDATDQGAPAAQRRNGPDAVDAQSSSRAARKRPIHPRAATTRTAARPYRSTRKPSISSAWISTTLDSDLMLSTRITGRASCPARTAGPSASPATSTRRSIRLTDGLRVAGRPTDPVRWNRTPPARRLCSSPAGTRDWRGRAPRRGTRRHPADRARRPDATRRPVRP